MKGKKYFLLSLVLAILAAGAIYNYLNEIEKQSKAAANLVKVYVAKSDIPARSKLDTAMFTSVELPQGALHEDAVTDKTVLTGAFAQDRLLAGEQVLTSRLVFTEDQNRLAYRVSAGHRAVTVAVNNVSGVAGFVLPGDYVDCIVTIDPPGSSDERQTLTTVVAANVRVLASGQTVFERDKEVLVADTVTLDAPAERVAAIILASERGSLRLVLRPAKDTKGQNVSVHRLSQFNQ